MHGNKTHGQIKQSMGIAIGDRQWWYPQHDKYYLNIEIMQSKQESAIYTDFKTNETMSQIILTKVEPWKSMLIICASNRNETYHRSNKRETCFVQAMQLNYQKINWKKTS